MLHFLKIIGMLAVFIIMGIFIYAFIISIIIMIHKEKNNKG